MLTRRTALLSSLAAGACATGPGMGEPADAQFRNLETLSESVHSGIASEDGELRCTVRLCRYPALGLAWLWMHARTPDGFFSFVDHLAPCGREATAAQNDRVSYSDTAGRLVFERLGPVDEPREARIRGQCLARKTTASGFGNGSHRMSVEITFHPARLYQGLNEGRTEVFGRSSAVLQIDGRTIRFEGPGQFHEQGQTTPRFTAPFCYATLWGVGDAASTMLIAPRRRNGYLLEGKKASDIASVAIDPPAARRAIRFALRDGRRFEGEASVVQAYTIPITGNLWRGHMVRVDMANTTFMGHVNDYIIAGGPPYLG